MAWLDLQIDLRYPGRPAGTPEMAARLRLEAPADAQAVALARRAVAGYDSLPAEVQEDLQTVISELVTNAVQHSGLTHQQSLLVQVTYDEDTVLVEVTDHGPGFDQAAVLDVEPTAQGGFGLRIVGELASAWGLARESGTVWAEIALA